MENLANGILLAAICNIYVERLNVILDIAKDSIYSMNFDMNIIVTNRGIMKEF